MDETNQMKQQTEDAAQECASVWDAICSKKVQNVSNRLKPLVMSALLFAGGVEVWLENFGGGIDNWQ